MINRRSFLSFSWMVNGHEWQTPYLSRVVTTRKCFNIFTNCTTSSMIARTILTMVWDYFRVRENLESSRGLMWCWWCYLHVRKPFLHRKMLCRVGEISRSGQISSLAASLNLSARYSTLDVLPDFPQFKWLGFFWRAVSSVSNLNAFKIIFFFTGIRSNQTESPNSENVLSTTTATTSSTVRSAVVGKPLTGKPPISTELPVARKVPNEAALQNGKSGFQ